MRETLNMLYRLVAPMFVVVLIIGGVGLSSELVKNSKEVQPAIAVAYAGGCPASAIPVNNEVCKARTITGQIIPNPCGAVTEKSGRIDGICVEYQGTGCCMAQSWLDEQSSIKLQLKDLLGDNFLSDAIKGIIGSIGGGGGGTGGYTGTGSGLEKPQCSSISKRPNLPLRPGETATIAWVQSGGLSQTTTVTPGVGIVRGTSVEVAPAESTTYTVKLRNSAGEAECPAIRVHVGPADAPDDGTTDTGGVGTGDEDYGADIWDGGDSEDTTTTSSNYDDLGTYIPDTTDDINVDTATGTTGADDTNYTGSAPYTPPSTWTPGDGLGITTNTTPSNITRDDWYDYNDEQLYRDPAEINKIARDSNSGLTDEEVYGIWNRPQSPATGGIGLSGGYVGDNRGVDLSSGETPGIFTRIGSWFKKVLCPWCDNSSALNTNNIYTSAALNSTEALNMSPVATCTTGTADTGIFVDRELVYKDSCDPSMTDQECRESWAGKRVKVEWGVPCGNVCTLTTKEGVLRPRVTQNGSLEGVVIKDTEFTLSCVDDLGESSEYTQAIRVAR